MHDKIFTPYTIGCKKCRYEFDLKNNLMYISPTNISVGRA